MVMAEMWRFVRSIEFVRMSVLWTLSLIYSYFKLLLASSNSSTQNQTHTHTDTPVCIITGATSGLGAAAALALSKQGFFVILVGRSGYKLSKTMAEIRTLNKMARLQAFEVDISSFSSVTRFKDTLQQWLLNMNLHSSLQLLINNAGILATSSSTSTHGFDKMMMTNYMGAFSLTKLLLPLLFNSPVPSRIVNVSSFTHRNVKDIVVDDKFVNGQSFSSSEKYPFARVYEYSKFCLILFSYELHRQITVMDKASQLSVNIADPGAVKTNIMREVPACISQLAYSVLNLMRLLQDPGEGVSSIIDASLAPPGTSGMYFFGGKGRTLRSSPLSYDCEHAEKLWAVSCNLFSELHSSYENTVIKSSTCDNQSEWYPAS